MAIKNVPKPKPKRKPAAEKAKDSTKQSLKNLEQEQKRLTDKQYRLRQKRKAFEKAEKAQQGEVTQWEANELEHLTDSSRAVIEEAQDVIFSPNPGPQTEFLAAGEREVLYGGAAGGGKSYGMLADPLRYCGYGDFRAILFRRTNDALRELIQKSKELYPRAYPGATWSKQESTWTFPSGAQIWLTYLDRDDDVVRYQGQAFQWIGFDELSQWPTPYPWDYMRSRLRSTNPNIPLYMRASANPGGAGGWWVRKMFIDGAQWGEPFPAFDLDSGRTLTYPKTHPKHGEPLFYRRFIPAKLQDNPYLFEDGQYESNLLSLPEAQRRQLLEGDWDVVEGAAFPEFRRSIHTCDPFEIPRGWQRFRAADWGYSSPACVLWFAVDWDGNLYVYRELYVKGVTADAFADLVLDAEMGEDIRYGLLDGSAWSKRGELGPAIAETMIRRGCRWTPADRSPGSRINGKLEIHRRLALNPTGQIDEETGEEIKKPGLIIFNNCVNLIRTLPILPLDKNKTEDVDTDSEDHAYDALRYGVNSRPMRPKDHFTDMVASPNSGGSFAPADSVFGY